MQEFISSMFTMEPLHPDLESYHETMEEFEVVRHPLVYSVPYFHIENKRLNALYDHKKKLLSDAIAINNLGKIVFLHERPWRLNAFVKHCETVSDEVFWDVFGSIWIDTEIFFQNRDEWLKLLNSKRQNRHLIMTADERDYYAKLPDAFTIYRGTSDSLQGMSWTVSKKTAEWFANRSNGHVYELVVNKKDTFAYLNRRDESEIVVDPTKYTIKKYKG